MGDGSVGIQEWARLLQEKSGECAFTLEIITGHPLRILNYLEPEFWEAYPDMPAAEFAQFLRLVKEEQPFMGPMPSTGGDEL
jgi:hypothetical protein